MGVAEAMQSMFWVLILTLVALYSAGILMTRIIGQGEIIDDTSGIDAATHQLFQSVSTSMFTLFVLMNGEDWRAMEPLLNAYPGMKVGFVIFTIFSSWALLSVMTGVVSDNMISAREAQNRKDEAVEGCHRLRIEKVVKDVYLAADAAGTGKLSKDRYNELLDVPYHAKKMESIAPNLPLKDLREMFEWLNADSNAGAKYADFLNGMQTLTEPITGKSLLQVESHVKHVFNTLQEDIGALEADISLLACRAKSDYDEFHAALSELRMDGEAAASENVEGAPVVHTLRS